MEQRQKAVLAGVNLNNQDSFESSMKELWNLAAACEISVVGEVTQKLDRVNAASYIGSGKIPNLVSMVKEMNADIVIFNDELSASQIRNIEEQVECKVIDRTMLILDIFARRAKTREAQLQVEAAQLHYMLPRLIGQEKAMGRQRGGVGTLNRGSGETKLELDRRRIEERITKLHQELETLVLQRHNQRSQRKKNEIPVVALVGYTNAGKSSIMNAMLEIVHSSTNKQVLEKDMLFATLGTSVRSIKLPDKQSFLLTDTVGFVSKLPHLLVKAFRSTLEEVTEADLLIHVVDYSNAQYEQQIQVTKETLKEIGADHIPVIYAFNKVDLTDAVEYDTGADYVHISAKTKKGMNNLIELVKQKVLTNYVQCEMLIPYSEGRVLSYLRAKANIKSVRYEGSGALLAVDCQTADYEKYKHFVKAPESVSL